MHTMLKSQRRWGIALIAAVAAWGTVGIAPAHAQSVPQAPVVILPVAPVVLSLPTNLPPMTVGITGKSRDGMIWSKSGRAHVDVAVDQHHGRAIVP